MGLHVRPVRRVSALALTLFLAGLMLHGAPAASAATPPQPRTSASASPGPYRPPVDAPVLDPFRAPSGPYAAGNRGIDYATAHGAPVRAIGAGVVVFAGVIAGARFVTMAHPDGLRSSYSWLDSVGVVTGQRLGQGDVVGRASSHIQLGVRRGRVYLDPATLFRARRRAHLVR